MKISILGNNDFNSSQSWKSVLRDGIRVAGIENCQYLFYIVFGIEIVKHFEGFHNTCCLWIRPYALEGMKQKFQKTTQKRDSKLFCIFIFYSYISMLF